MATMLLAASGGAIAGNFADKLMRDNVAVLQNPMIRNAVKIGAGVGLGYALGSPMAVNFGAGMAMSGTVGLAESFIPGISGTGYAAANIGNYAELEPTAPMYALSGTGNELSQVISGTGYESVSGTGNELSQVISGFSEFGEPSDEQY